MVELLRTLTEARIAYSYESTGDGVRLMPSMYSEGSYAELESRLRDLRESRRRQLWWHISQRYRFGVERLIVCPVVRRRTGPEFCLPPHCELVAGGPAIGARAAYCRVYRWRAEVNLELVAQGVSVLTRSMFGGESQRIVLPQVVLRRVLGMPEPEAEVA